MRNTTSVDWWAFRGRGEVSRVFDAVEGVFADSPVKPTFETRTRGYMGYQNAASIMLGDMPAGLVAWGGASQRGWNYVSITGDGCDWVGDWCAAQDAAQQLDGYEVRRLDIALDTYDPSISYDSALAAYNAGRFVIGGRNPKARKIEPLQRPDGRTLYIGSRENDKFLRCYEKGWQQLGRSIKRIQDDGDDVTDPEVWISQMQVYTDDQGGRVCGRLVDWFRHELELKPKSGELPEDLIDRRDQYFAGAYPYLGDLLQDVESSALIIRRPRKADVELQSALAACRAQWGDVLFTACTLLEGDIGAVWAQIVGQKHSERLLRAGVLL